MLIQRIVKKALKRGPSAAVGNIGGQLSRAILPRPLRVAASRLLAMLAEDDEEDDDGDGNQKGAAIVNISIAIAVGAPGKEDADEAAPASLSRKDAVVVATAVTGDPDSNTGRIALSPEASGVGADDAPVKRSARTSAAKLSAKPKAAKRAKPANKPAPRSTAAKKRKPA